MSVASPRGQNSRIGRMSHIPESEFPGLIDHNNCPRLTVNYTDIQDVAEKLSVLVYDNDTVVTYIRYKNLTLTVRG